MQENKPQLIVIFLLCALAGYILAPIANKWPDFLANAKIEKGIDVAGGAELTYRVLYESGYNGNKKTDTQKVVDVLHQRFRNKKGALMEPRFTTRGEDLISLQMPGIDADKLNDYKRLVTTIGRLELKKVASKEIHEAYNSSGQVPAGYLAFRAEHAEPEAGIKDYVLCEADNVITGEDVAEATHEFLPAAGGRNWGVNFVLHDLGAKKFDDAAEKLYAMQPHGKIAIIIDHAVKSAPSVNSDSFKGRGQITGNFDEQSSNELAIVLKSGSLPVAIGRRNADGKAVEKEPEAENFVGPSLGQDSIMRGIYASVIAMIFVTLFMVIYYRVGGFVAIVALGINMLWLMALMAIFGATLTLPGLAGIVLTIGMAVDANILILERIREEMLKGKSAAQAFEAGHERALTTVVDSNLTTMIAGIVLYYFGTGAVQGFAVTLVLGIITNLVSDLWAAKVFMRMLVSSSMVKTWNMMSLFKTPKFDFVRLVKLNVGVSTLLSILSIVIFMYRGDKQMGIDFKGGTRLHFAFASPQEIDYVRTSLGQIKTTIDGKPVEKYPDAEIQSVASPGSGYFKLNQTQSREFQLRSGSPNEIELKNDIQEIFKDRLSHEPFEEAKGLPVNDREFGGAGTAPEGLFVYALDEAKFKVDALDKQLAKAFTGILDKDEEDPNKRPFFKLTEMTDAPKGLKKILVTISKKDFDAQDNRLVKVKEAIRKESKAADTTFALASNPFVAVDKLGPTVAGELRDKTAWALIISWILMILYITVRFSHVPFGVAAVIALIHDALIAVGFVSFMGWVVPKSWGISFDMDMNTVAAVLTVIGYSINNTIVIFDRIRENLHTMKKESFREVINASVNQALARTVLTSFTVWFTCVILFAFTMTSAGGIASFALPMLIGVLVGTYSSIFVAPPLLIWWYKNEKPATA